MILHPMQQIIHFDIGVTAMRVVHLNSFAEERVRFVEEKERITLVRGAKDKAEVVFRFANVLRDHLAQIDPIKIPA